MRHVFLNLNVQFVTVKLTCIRANVSIYVLLVLSLITIFAHLVIYLSVFNVTMPKTVPPVIRVQELSFQMDLVLSTVPLVHSEIRNKPFVLTVLRDVLTAQMLHIAQLVSLDTGY